MLLKVKATGPEKHLKLEEEARTVLRGS